jgi:hypothetical protein
VGIRTRPLGAVVDELPAQVSEMLRAFVCTAGVQTVRLEPLQDRNVLMEYSVFYVVYY